jgi:hypothetical protein
VQEFAQKDARKYNIVVFFSQQTGIDAVYCRAIDRLLFLFHAVCVLPEAPTNFFCLLYVNFGSKM